MPGAQDSLPVGEGQLKQLDRLVHQQLPRWRNNRNLLTAFPIVFTARNFTSDGTQGGKPE
jgi:hypothetical protein